MPIRKPSRACHHPNCPNPQPCPKHKRAPWQHTNRRRRLPPDWRQLRTTILQRDPTCQVCGQRPSTQVDHITPGDNHHPTNLQGICVPCHRTKSAREGRAAQP